MLSVDGLDPDTEIALLADAAHLASVYAGSYVQAAAWAGRCAAS